MEDLQDKQKRVKVIQVKNINCKTLRNGCFFFEIILLFKGRVYTQGFIYGLLKKH